jgi:hypothetical protein
VSKARPVERLVTRVTTDPAWATWPGGGGIAHRGEHANLTLDVAFNRDTERGTCEDTAMIKVEDVIAWSASDRGEYAELRTGELDAWVRNLRRSIDF